MKTAPPMTLGNRTVRSGTDTRVLAGSVLRRLEYDAAAIAQRVPAAAPVAAPPLAESLLRKVLKWGYRRVKPLLRPVTRRARAYINRPLEDRLDRIEHLLAEHMAKSGSSAFNKALSPVNKQMAALDDRVKELTRTVMAHNPQLDALRTIAPVLSRIEQYSMAAARRIAVPCGAGQILARTDLGFVMCSAADPAMLSLLLEGGEVERGTRLLIQRYLRPGDVFLDVGANLGLHTLAAARALAGKGRVIAFEPFAETRELLASTVWINGFSDLVEIHEVAVSSRSGEQALHLGATSGHHSLFELPGQGIGKSVQVRVVRLDDVLPAGTPVQLVKIDVEGAEVDVVEGAQRLLQDNAGAGLIVEFGRSHLRRAGNTPASWLRPFRALGLEFRRIDPEDGSLLECREADLEQVDAANLFFARPGKDAWRRVMAPT